MKKLGSLALAVTLAGFLFVGGCKQKCECPKEKVYNSPKEMVKDFIAKYKIPQITPEELKQKKSEFQYIIDVREPSEYKAGHLEGAINIPRGVLEFKIGKKVSDKNAKILIYCKKGGRGALAVRSLQLLGYKNAVNLKGGFEAAKKVCKVVKEEEKAAK